MLVEKFHIKTIKFLIYFILSSMWFCIRKTKLLGQIFTSNDVSMNVNIKIRFRL
jgi:hypothetical protein